MNEREMLELAAKAAGYEVLAYDATTDELTCRSVERGTFIWAPRKDDGDALRLAVKLLLQVTVTRDGIHAEGIETDGILPYAYEADGDDPYAATRLAITRAAAEIGRAMK